MTHRSPSETDRLLECLRRLAGKPASPRHDPIIRKSDARVTVPLPDHRERK